MAGALFAEAGDVVSVLDTDGTSAVENVEKILENLIAQKRADAFFTCGANRLFQLMKRVGKALAHSGTGGDGAGDGVRARPLLRLCAHLRSQRQERAARQVHIEGPVFDMQEAVGW